MANVSFTTPRNGSTGLHSGAELERLCHEAAHAALREDMTGASEVCMQHFRRALDCSSPSLTSATLMTYARWGSASNGHRADQ